MFQLSLRSLLVLVALVALAIVSLRFASHAWQTLVLAITMIAVWVAVIVAVVDRGERQAFAIGFSVSTLLYVLVLYSFDLGTAGQEFNPDRGKLPTSQALRPIFHAVAEVRRIDLRSGQVLEAVDRQNLGAAGSANISMGEFPSRQTFMTIGHAWWAILLGLCGGWFARWVYVRRTRGQPPLASGRS